jgi:hypothetical protein
MDNATAVIVLIAAVIGLIVKLWQLFDRIRGRKGSQ